MNFWQKLFGKREQTKTASHRAKTSPLDPTRAGNAIARGHAGHILVGCYQSAGMERDHNEDALLVLFGNAAGETALPDFGMFVVADGMGGHRSGEVASAISIRAVAQKLTSIPLLHLFDLNPDDDIPPLQDLMREALEEANRLVVDEVPGGGSTLTTVFLLGSQMTIGHVGDSRAYIIQDGQHSVVTRDHSLVKRLEELGQLTEDEAAIHPQRNVLYKAIGQGASLEVDVVSYPVPRDGFLLVCSDGLWGVIPEEELLQIVRSSDHPQIACERLVEAANAAGGPDNITAVLVYFPPVQTS